MNKLPQRDDLIYKEIEEFKNYELTNCIAYEMVIRNDELNKLILDCFLDKGIYNFNNIVEDIDKFEKFGFNNTDCLVNYVIKQKTNEYFTFSGKITSFHYSTILINDYSKKHQGRKINVKNIDKEYYKTVEINPSNINHNSIPKLEFIYSRPQLSLKKNKKADISININLPKEELIAYISKIKDDFDKDNSIIKTPLELLGETLEKSDNKKSPKKPKASVYADWFYIYDYWKYEKVLGKTDKDIFVALEVENNIPYKEDMIRKIRDKMRYFIDDLGYKELITGVKNS